MFNASSPSFSLENFEGPLELLLYLIQKDEMDICEVVIKQLTEQLISATETNCEVDTSSELLALTSTLLVLKSKKLVPQDEETQIEEEDPRIEMIQNLIEYCRIKDAAKVLSLKEEEQQAHFPRSASPFRKEIGNGLEEVDLEDLQTVLLSVMSRVKETAPQVIKDEEWRISDKIAWFRQIEDKTPFLTVFSDQKSRQELIVLFLALLELMKLQELRIVRETDSLYIVRYEPRT